MQENSEMAPSATTTSWYTISQVAEIFNVSKGFIYSLIKRVDNELPYAKFGRCIRFRKEDVEAYAERCMQS